MVDGKVNLSMMLIWMSSPDDDDDDHVNDDDADHSQDDNDDDDDDRKRFHSQLMDGVLWVLVGLLFVAGITARHCGLLCIVYCVLCIVYCVLCIVYRVSCIAYHVLRIVYRVLCIVYCVSCILCCVHIVYCEAAFSWFWWRCQFLPILTPHQPASCQIPSEATTEISKSYICQFSSNNFACQPQLSQESCCRAFFNRLAI